MTSQVFTVHNVERGKEEITVLVGSVLITFPDGKVPEVRVASPGIEESIKKGETLSTAMKTDEVLATACEMFEEADARWALAKHNVTELANLYLRNDLKSFLRPK